MYAPVDIPAMKDVVAGGDPEVVALLPSGFSILPDCTLSTNERLAYFGQSAASAAARLRRPAGGSGSQWNNEECGNTGEVDSLEAQSGRFGSGAEGRGNDWVPEGSLLTVSFQILVSPDPEVRGKGRGGEGRRGEER